MGVKFIFSPALNKIFSF